MSHRELNVFVKNPGQVRDGYRSPVLNRARAKLSKTVVLISSDITSAGLGIGEIKTIDFLFI